MNTPTAAPRRERTLAYGVHLYTAAGLVCSGLTLAAVSASPANFRMAIFWLTVAVLIDATDGFLARRFRVKQVLPHIDGRKLDDIIDFLNYSFLPLLLLLWHGGLLPWPAWLWISLPLVASAMAFSNTGAKEEDEGFFLGFPSYWNIFAFYALVASPWLGPHARWLVGGGIVLFSVLSVAPVRFVYPNRAPRWKWFFLGGAAAWLAMLLWILALYPDRVPPWLILVSLIYPVLYVLLSFLLAWAMRDTAPKNSPKRLGSI